MSAMSGLVGSGAAASKPAEPASDSASSANPTTVAQAFLLRPVWRSHGFTNVMGAGLDGKPRHLGRVEIQSAYDPNKGTTTWWVKGAGGASMNITGYAGGTRTGAFKAAAYGINFEKRVFPLLPSGFMPNSAPAPGYGPVNKAAAAPRVAELSYRPYCAGLFGGALCATYSQLDSQGHAKWKISWTGGEGTVVVNAPLRGQFGPQQVADGSFTKNRIGAYVFAQRVGDPPPTIKQSSFSARGMDPLSARLAHQLYSAMRTDGYRIDVAWKEAWSRHNNGYAKGGPRGATYALLKGYQPPSAQQRQPVAQPRSAPYAGGTLWIEQNFSGVSSNAYWFPPGVKASWDNVEEGRLVFHADAGQVINGATFAPGTAGRRNLDSVVAAWGQQQGKLGNIPQPVRPQYGPLLPGDTRAKVSARRTKEQAELENALAQEAKNWVTVKADYPRSQGELRKQWQGLGYDPTWNTRLHTVMAEKGIAPEADGVTYKIPNNAQGGYLWDKIWHAIGVGDRCALDKLNSTNPDPKVYFRGRANKTFVDGYNGVKFGGQALGLTQNLQQGVAALGTGTAGARLVGRGMGLRPQGPSILQTAGVNVQKLELKTQLRAEQLFRRSGTNGAALPTAPRSPEPLRPQRANEPLPKTQQAPIPTFKPAGKGGSAGGSAGSNSGAFSDLNPQNRGIQPLQSASGNVTPIQQNNIVNLSGRGGVPATVKSVVPNQTSLRLKSTSDPSAPGGKGGAYGDGTASTSQSSKGIEGQKSIENFERLLAAFKEKEIDSATLTKAWVAAKEAFMADRSGQIKLAPGYAKRFAIAASEADHAITQAKSANQQDQTSSQSAGIVSPVNKGTPSPPQPASVQPPAPTPQPVHISPSASDLQPLQVKSTGTAIPSFPVKKGDLPRGLQPAPTQPVQELFKITKSAAEGPPYEAYVHTIADVRRMESAGWKYSGVIDKPAASWNQNYTLLNAQGVEVTVPDKAEARRLIADTTQGFRYALVTQPDAPLSTGTSKKTSAEPASLTEDTDKWNKAGRTQVFELRIETIQAGDKKTYVGTAVAPSEVMKLRNAGWTYTGLKDKPAPGYNAGYQLVKTGSDGRPMTLTVPDKEVARALIREQGFRYKTVESSPDPVQPQAPVSPTPASGMPNATPATPGSQPIPAFPVDAKPLPQALDSSLQDKWRGVPRRP